MDAWLRKRALGNEGTDSRTYVMCEGLRVVGYYALATGSVQRNSAPGKMRRNAPDPVSVMVLGRLAIDEALQGRGFGKALLRDAILRCLQVRELAGLRAILAHAKSEKARSFYEAQDFSRSPLDPMTLMLALDDAARALG